MSITSALTATTGEPQGVPRIGLALAGTGSGVAWQAWRIILRMADWDCTTRDTEETLALGASLGQVLLALDCAQLTVSLEGDLGAGKTVFVRGLAHGLGVAPDTRIVSPTYTIARSYRVPRGRIELLHHLDAYRLGGADDLDAIGFEEMCGIGCLTCVEWGTNVAEALPEDRMRIQLVALPPEQLEPGEAPECPRAVRAVALGAQALQILEAWAASFGTRAE